MFGTLYYFSFLILGLMISKLVLKNRDIYFDILSGGILGNMILMCGIIPFAFLFGFNKSSHILLLIISAAIISLLFFKKKPTFKFNQNIPLIFTVIPITLLICILLTNHVMAPIQGGITSGQSTYGDLAMHMGFVSSIAEQGIFPPSYNVLSGTKLNYPFLIESLSSSLHIFGTSLRWSILIPSFVFCFLIVLGFYKLCLALSEKNSAAVISCILFFIGGGFGFIYFLNGSFTEIFTGYYTTPTNFIEKNIRWVNPICDMIIPQRTTMAGWCFIIYALLLLYHAKKEQNRCIFALLGIIGGCMPLIHTHSFTALAIISFVLMIFDIVKNKNYFKNWLIFAVIAAVIATPQLFYWTFSQVSGNTSFLNFKFNWANSGDNYFIFYLKNWGIALLLLIPSILAIKKEHIHFLAASGVVMLIAEFIQFQPNPYDNNKLIFITYMIIIMAIGCLCAQIKDRLKNKKCSVLLITLIIFLGTFSGVLSIVREYISAKDYITFSDSDIEFSEFVKENTDPHAVFLTGSEHLNPISALSGRNIYLGSDLYVYFHGFHEEIQKRSSVVKNIYESKSISELLSLCEGIDYIYVSNYEREEFDLSENIISQLTPVYKNILYKVQKN